MVRADVGKNCAPPYVFYRRTKSFTQGSIFHLLLLRCKELVDFRYELVGVSTVNGTSLLNGLASGVRAAKTVHSDFKEESCTLYVKVEDITDEGVFGYVHFYVPAFFIFNNNIVA